MPQRSGLIVLIVIFVTAFLSAVFFGNSLFAQTAGELQSQIDAKSKEIQALEAEIAQYKSELDKVGKDKTSLNSAIATLDLEKKKLLTDIKVTEAKINSANLNLTELSTDISDKATTITKQQLALRQSIKKLHQLDQSSLLEIFLSKDRISDTWREIGDLVLFEKEIDEHVKALTDAKYVLETNKKEVELVKSDLLSLQSDRTDQKKIVDQNALEKANLLKQTKAKESNYNALLAAKLAKKMQFEQDVRTYESQLKFILNPSSIPVAGSAPFIWPVDNVRVTQLFGKTVSAVKLYVSGSHNGVDFGAPTGTPAKALAYGTVIGTGNTDLACPGASYGNWILIDYDNGLTSVYAHLSLVKAKVGERVATGQVVAYAGSTGYSTGPHLHVTIWPHGAAQIMQVPSKACTGKVYTQPVAAINAYLDPMLYFPPVQPSMIYYK